MMWMLKGFDVNIWTFSSEHFIRWDFMMALVFLFLLLSAFSPPVHNRVFTFHLIYRLMNQTEGRAACRENHTDLVTVYSDGDNADLCNMILKAGSGSKSGWIGLIRGQFSEKWSNGDPVTFRSLAGVCGTSTCCAVMKPDGLWESLQCTETKNFMCYKKGDTEPRQNYHLIPENKTWYGAQRYCRSKYTDLVSIRDQQQNEEVKMEGLNSTTPFWIGLLCDDWQWTDGGNSTYRNWMIGEPKLSPSNCVSLGPGGQWYSVPCSNEYLFTLCYTFSPPVHNCFFTFHLISGYMNQTEGRAACRENHTDLVTVHSDGDNTDLCNILLKAGSGSRFGWIGPIRGQFSEKWSNGDPVTFRSLAGVCRTSICCAVMKPDGLWESLQCTKTKYFMCYKKGDTEPRQNYHLIPENKTWYGAQRYCRSKYTDLVSIRDQQQNEEVKMEGLNSTTPFWIGLLCDDWQWTDGGNSTYRNWMSGSPHSSPYDCVSLGSGGQWNSVLCSDEYLFTLCYTSSIHVSDVAMSWEKALDYCQHGNRAGILNIDSEAEQKELESELRRRRVPAGSLWVGLGPKRLSELKVSSSPLTCEDVKRQTESPPSRCPADTHTAGAEPGYVMDSTELLVACRLK